MICFGRACVCMHLTNTTVVSNACTVWTDRKLPHRRNILHHICIAIASAYRSRAETYAIGCTLQDLISGGKQITHTYTNGLTDEVYYQVRSGPMQRRMVKRRKMRIQRF
ncbi:hypothetical protein KP509_26G002800 [Ceratopteris richardii]|uniref:Uncharacterized protein n=1 Tax=Ceratopteris richardii TaxID=49495 RepID=A0A8T2RJJ2_CERRI|nr:hypothetical protein KP509_26G002800 [Ceratopteris richardii]